MVYVERRNGQIFGVYANLQAGYAEEAIPADDPEVLACREAADRRFENLPD